MSREIASSDDSGRIERIDAARLETAVAAIIRAEGGSDDNARIVARCLVEADLAGVETHGVMRLPTYVERLRTGGVDGKVEPIVRETTPVAVQVDGKNGFGFVAATKAVDEAVSRARHYGVGLAGVRHSSHFGMASIYPRRAAEAGFVSFVVSNAPPALPPHGGKVPLFGTNPIAFAVPGDEGAALIFDMAPSVAARGRIRKAAARGEPIPQGWALDEAGNPTTDPQAALGGVVLAIGGAKGAGLAMMVDILAGLMTGAGSGGTVGSQHDGAGEPQDVGHFVLVMRPDIFLDSGDFDERMTQWSRLVRATPPAPGFETIRLPGERRAASERDRRNAGIPIARSDLDRLRAMAEHHAIAL